MRLITFGLFGLLSLIKPIIGQNYDPAYVRSTMDGCFFRGRESFHQAANVNCVYREMIQPWEPNLIDQCKEAYRQGCILAAASGQCQRGEQHSSQSGACSAFPVPHDQHPMSYLRRCCDACVGGQNYYDHNSTCPTLERPLLLNSLLIDAQSIVAKAPLTFESESAKMLQETFIRCCAAQRNQVITKRASNLEAFIDEDNEKQFWDRCSKEHKCEHLCIDSGEQETHCACNPGFVLSSDLRSCIRISPCPGPYCAEQTSTVSSQKRNLNEDNSVEEEEEEEPAEEDWKGRQVKSNATSETESKLEHDSIDTNSTSNDINSLNTTLIGHTNTPTVSTESSNQTITKTVVTNSTKLDDDNKQLNQFKCVNGTYDPYLGACDPTDPPSIVPQMMSTLINRRVDETKSDKYDLFCKETGCASETRLDIEMKPKNCSTGFWYNEGADACEDVDECDDHVLPACGDGEICINRLGSVECLPENQDFKCDAGYQKINRKCVDVNECETSLACQSNQTCVNYLGGFKCVTVQLSSTNPEIRLNLDAAERVDTTISPVSSSTSLLIIPTPEPMDNDTISEIFNVDIFNMTNEDSAKESKCTEGTCKAGETCIKDGPLIKCKLICQPNQNLDFINNACVNISDCKNGKSCEQGQDCVKFTNGTYSCQEQCSSGFKRDDASGECVDVDECMFFANRCDKFKSRCVNRIGSYECECFTGYHHPNNEHKQICVDIDECANGTHNCLQNSTCYNKDGSFECRCHHGYRKQNGTCVDIDECAGELKDSCPGECINRPGGYVCHVCPFGFKAGSKPGSCMRINNCTGPKKCKDGEMCVSLIHRHRCVNTRCPSLYHDNQIQPNFCILDRKEARSRPDFRTSKRPYSLQHLVMVIPNLFQPPISTSSNVSTISPLYLLATEQTIFNSSNNRYSYDLGIESPHYKDFVHEHFSLVPRSPKELALTLIKPIEGPKDLTLNIDLIFKHKILQRKVLHLFVDERTE